MLTIIVVFLALAMTGYFVLGAISEFVVYRQIKNHLILFTTLVVISALWAWFYYLAH